MKFGIPFPE